MPQLKMHGCQTIPVLICGVLYHVEGKKHIRQLLIHHGLDPSTWREYRWGQGRVHPLKFWEDGGVHGTQS